MTARFVPEGEVLFEYESLGYEFFIILSGKVSIHINLKGVDYTDKKKEMVASPDIPLKTKTADRWKSNFKGKNDSKKASPKVQPTNSALYTARRPATM